MIGSVSERLAPEDRFLTNGTNGSVVMDTEARDVQRVKVAAATTLLCGIFQVSLAKQHMKEYENKHENTKE